MNKIFSILILFTSLSIIPSISLGICVQTGQAGTLFVTPSDGPSAVDVRTVAPGSATYRFTTSDSKLLNALASAQSSHQLVRVRGGDAFSVCPATGALRAGGALVSVQVAPD